MRGQLARWGAGVLVPVMFLVAAAWWGGRLIELQRQAGQTFEPDGLAWAMSLAYLLAAGGAAGIFVACRVGHSRLIALAYVLAGALVVFDQPLTFTYGATINGTPPIAPAPVVTLLNEIYTRLEFGPVGVAQVMGGAMLVAGLVELGRHLPGVMRPPRAQKDPDLVASTPL